MPIQRDRSAIDPENLGSQRVQRPFPDEILNISAPLEVGIDADQGLRPEAAALVEGVNLGPDVFRADLGERPGEPFVILDKCSVQIKYVHVVPWALPCAMGRIGKVQNSPLSTLT